MDASIFEKTVVALLLSRHQLSQTLKSLLQAFEHLKLPSHSATTLLDLQFLLGKQLSLLVYAIFDALQGNLSRHAQRIALENIFTPLDTVLLNVNKQLLYQHSLIVKFLFLFGQHRGIKLDLRIHFFFRVIKGGWLLSNTT